MNQRRRLMSSPSSRTRPTITTKRCRASLAKEVRRMAVSARRRTTVLASARRDRLPGREHRRRIGGPRRTRAERRFRTRLGGGHRAGRRATARCKKCPQTTPNNAARRVIERFGYSTTGVRRPTIVVGEWSPGVRWCAAERRHSTPEASTTWRRSTRPKRCRRHRELSPAARATLVPMMRFLSRVRAVWT